MQLHWGPTKDRRSPYPCHVPRVDFTLSRHHVSVHTRAEKLPGTLTAFPRPKLAKSAWPGFRLAHKANHVPFVGINDGWKSAQKIRRVIACGKVQCVSLSRRRRNRLHMDINGSEFRKLRSRIFNLILYYVVLLKTYLKFMFMIWEYNICVLVCYCRIVSTVVLFSIKNTIFWDALNWNWRFSQ